MVTPNDADDRPSIAELQRYGLSLKIINLLEENFTYLYIDELQGLTVGMLLDVPMIGPGSILSLGQALGRWLEEKPVNTEEECARMKQ